MARRRSTRRSGSAALAGWWKTTKAQDVVTRRICGCGPAKDPWSPSFSPTTDSDLAFGADPFGDRAASEDLPQPESQPDFEGDAGWVAMLE